MTKQTKYANPRQLKPALDELRTLVMDGDFYGMRSADENLKCYKALEKGYEELQRSGMNVADELLTVRGQILNQAACEVADISKKFEDSIDCINSHVNSTQMLTERTPLNFPVYAKLLKSRLRDFEAYLPKVYSEPQSAPNNQQKPTKLNKFGEIVE